MIAVDTSVVVAAFASWHEAHAAAAMALDRRPRIPAHVLVETLSVLNRLPPPHRAPVGIVTAFLGERLFDSPLTLPARRYRDFLATVTDAGLTGGAVYDALIGITAKDAGATLLTRDRRASAIYDRLNVRYELVE